MNTEKICCVLGRVFIDFKLSWLCIKLQQIYCPPSLLLFCKAWNSPLEFEMGLKIVISHTVLSFHHYLHFCILFSMYFSFCQSQRHMHSRVCWSLHPPFTALDSVTVWWKFSSVMGENWAIFINWVWNWIALSLVIYFGVLISVLHSHVLLCCKFCWWHLVMIFWKVLLRRAGRITESQNHLGW